MGVSSSAPAPSPRSPAGESHSPLREREARTLIGARFRLHGRDPDYGLDCVGVVAWVYRLAVPTGYRMRTDDVLRVEQALASIGFVQVESAPGFVALLRPGPQQLHLGVVTAGGFVHADAGLGRVVESPWRADWPILGFWRRGEG